VLQRPVETTGAKQTSCSLLGMPHKAGQSRGAIYFRSRRRDG